MLDVVKPAVSLRAVDSRGVRVEIGMDYHRKRQKISCHATGRLRTCGGYRNQVIIGINCANKNGAWINTITGNGRLAITWQIQYSKIAHSGAYLTQQQGHHIHLDSHSTP